MDRTSILDPDRGQQGRRRADRFLGTLERFYRFEEALPVDRSALSQNERVERLAQFMDREPDAAAVRDAVAVLAAERGLSWNTNQSVWRGLAVLAFPEVAASRQRLSELTKVLEATANHPPREALAIVQVCGGVSTLGKRPAKTVAKIVRAAGSPPRRARGGRSSPRS